ncbi:unnamed protein product [Lymnaea stagnalis]|uniref:Roadblock/LAMTOR2 domain-containing protein n=1 Tax=Lymnaea stagnalis TaxID=6523 RepID=A0AAV2IIP6_LYMST
MSYEDLISHILTTTDKVNKIIVFDLTGRPVAYTEGTETNQSEGMALVNCLLDPAKIMTKLFIDNDFFICVQGIEKTFTGTNIKDRSRVIVARLDDSHVIVLFGQSTGKGSFTYELQHSLELRSQGLLISQLAEQQQQQRGIPDAGTEVFDTQRLNDVVRGDQVLVNLK